MFIDNEPTIVFENIKGQFEGICSKLGIKDTFQLYQENDAKHKAYKARSWLHCNCPKVVEPPPQTPDMNPLEN